MESLLVKANEMPIRAIPEDLRAKKVEHDLYPFLKALLSLDDEKHVDRLPGLLLMIEKAAYSLTFSEIKKAFTKYANNELTIKPMSNHLDAVLFSNVIDEYKKQRPVKKTEHKTEISEEEKERNAFLNCVYAFDDWLPRQEVSYEYHTAYDELKSRGLIKVPDKGESKKIMELAKSRLLRESSTNREFKEAIRKVLNTKEENQWVINYGKCELLSRYFKKIKEQKKHIKDIL